MGSSPSVCSSTFAAGKEAAIRYLDTCPVDVIRHFINRSWHSMSVYQMGLTGSAAEWAVRKFRLHGAISAAALDALESVTTK